MHTKSPRKSRSEQVLFLLGRVRGRIVHCHLYFDGGIIIRKALARLELFLPQHRRDRG
jgi:hypothetical protein